VRRQGRVRRAPGEGTAARAAGDPGSGRVPTARPGHQSGGGAALRGQAAASPRDRGGAFRFPSGRLGGCAGAAGLRSRRGGDHDRRPAGARAPGRGLGRHGRRRNRPAGAARHESRPHAHARARRGRTAAAGAGPEADPGGCRPRGAADQRAVRRAAAPCVRGAGAAIAAMTALVGLWLVLQGGGWVATPARPTVGDTVWLERQVVVPAGWRVRAGRLDPTERVEPLGEPSVRRAPGGWLVRYPIVAWTPGAHTLALPPIWELRPDGRAAFRLRVAVARAIPEARPALSTAECIAAVERARPHASLRELRELLEQLDRVAFASAHGTDVAALAQMARRFAQELER